MRTCLLLPFADNCQQTGSPVENKSLTAARSLPLVAYCEQRLTAEVRNVLCQFAVRRGHPQLDRDLLVDLFRGICHWMDGQPWGRRCDATELFIEAAERYARDLEERLETCDVSP